MVIDSELICRRRRGRSCSTAVASLQGKFPEHSHLDKFRAQEVLADQKKAPVLHLRGCARLALPRGEKESLGLDMRFVVLQGCFLGGYEFEFVFEDELKTQRRVVVSRLVKKADRKGFCLRCPSPKLEEERWETLCVDIASFSEVFQAKFQLLVRVTVLADCRLRRVLAVRHELNDSLGQ